MNCEPQKFFIGLVDFFSILLPGAVLTYLLKGAAGPWILGTGYQSLKGAEAWVILLFTSYLLGHFLFFAGSFLDDFVYNPVRRATDKEQIVRLWTGRRLSPRPVRWLAMACFKAGADTALGQIIRIQQGYLKRIGATGAVNAFQWCKSRLATEHPEALATVNRFEADSKFFRSFVPVLAALMGMAFYHRQWGQTSTWLGFMALALLRYMDQRFKSTQQAYWTIITLEASKESPQYGTDAPKSAPKDGSSAATHAGGVVFRKRWGKVKYLLVEAKKDARQWVLPKGHIEPGEEPQRTAIREVREETGVWAQVVRDLDISQYEYQGEAIKVQFYLMRALAEGKPEDALRRHDWLALDDALEKTKAYQQIRELFLRAGDPATRGMSAGAGRNNM